MVFEAHCMSFPCTELLLFNYAKVKTVFHSMAPLRKRNVGYSLGLYDAIKMLIVLICDYALNTHVEQQQKSFVILYSLVPSLRQDCPTRWGSKQKMIQRVLEQANAIKRALDDRRHQHLNLTWQDIAVLESINAALKPVVEFTDVLSNEKVISASSVKPVLRLLTNDLLDPTPEDSELTKKLQRKDDRCLG